MPDREKVIRRLAEVSEYTRAKADIAGIGKGKEIFDSWFRAAEDAIALLREQEPVPFDEIGYQPVCGVCHEVLDVTDEYCRCCGRKVRWKHG